MGDVGGRCQRMFYRPAGGKPGIAGFTRIQSGPIGIRHSSDQAGNCGFRIEGYAEKHPVKGGRADPCTPPSDQLGGMGVRVAVGVTVHKAAIAKEVRGHQVLALFCATKACGGGGDKRLTARGGTAYIRAQIMGESATLMPKEQPPRKLSGPRTVI